MPEQKCPTCDASYSVDDQYCQVCRSLLPTNKKSPRIKLTLPNPFYYLVVAGVLILASFGTWWFSIGSRPPKLLPTPTPITSTSTLCIGTDFPTTGPDASKGTLLGNGADLAITSNRNLGLGYVLNACDKNDVSPKTNIHDPDTGAQNVRQLIADNTVIGLVGPGNSNVALAEIPIAAQAGLPIVGPYTSVLCLTQSGYCTDPGQVHPAGVPNTFFRVCGNDEQQGQAVSLLFKSLHLQTAFVVDDGEVYGQELADIFTQDIQRDGETVLGRDHISDGEQSSQLTELAQRIVSQKPEPKAVFYAGVTSNEGGTLKEQLVQAGFTGPLIGGTGIADDPQFLSDASPDANDTYAMASGPDLSGPNPSNSSQSFTKAYQNAYGNTPSQPSAQSYDAAMILITAIKSVIKDNPQVMHSDIETIRKAVLNQLEHPDQPYHGITGTITFDSNGDNTAPQTFSAYAVENGQWVYKSEYTITVNG